MTEYKNTDEWMKKIIAVSDANKKVDEEDDSSRSNTAEKKSVVEENPKRPLSIGIISIAVGLFFLSVAVRLAFMYLFTNPQNAGVGWYNDSYHHWQIAYLTKEIGLHTAFLRLWDLIGMEYFWGLVQPLILAFLFTITGTADILVLRFFNIFVGSLNILVLFLLGRKYFNWQAGLAAALIAIFNPVGVFTDTSGMQEPLGILMLLSAIYFWPQKAYLSALFFFLASMCRAEYWVFSVCLVLILLIFQKTYHKKLLLGGIYFVLMFIYMKYLLDKTGNAIYPVYWNFLGNAAGKWQANVPLSTEQSAIQIVFIGILVISFLLAIFFLWKKPRGYLFSLLGLGNFIFLGGFVGLSAYLRSYLPRFWVDRIFWLPYMWLGFLLAALLLYYVPRFAHSFGKILGWLLVFIVIIICQMLWLPIRTFSSGSEAGLREESATATVVMKNYSGGSVLIPGGDPVFTYELYKHGLQGKDIRGEMFDPYFYFTDLDPYEHWDKHRKVVLQWLKNENIKLMVFRPVDAKRYVELVKIEPDLFVKHSDVDGYSVYSVNDITTQ